MRVVRVKDGKVSGQFLKPLVVTLGSFDGLHRGHREVIEQVVREAKAASLCSAVVSFHPHPSVGLGKIEKLPLITTFRQRVHLLTEWGIDYFVLIRFTKDLSQLRWDEFCTHYLHDLLGAQKLIIGPDARVGKGGEGTADLIAKKLRECGASVSILPFVEGAGGKVASRSIRDAIAAGRVKEAALLLDRPFALEGKVIHGDGRGAALGIPTANLFVPEQVIPRDGVYCGFANIDGQRYPAVANIGMRPTFQGGARQVEVHCLGGDKGDFYKKRLEFVFIDRLREEKKFSTVDELLKQIRKDIEKATSILNGAT